MRFCSFPFPAQVSARPSRVVRRQGRVRPHRRLPAGPAGPLHPEPERCLPKAGPRRPPRGHPTQPEEVVLHLRPRLAHGGGGHPAPLHEEREAGAVVIPTFLNR